MTTTIFHDSYGSGANLSVHNPDVGGPYSLVGGTALTDVHISGGVLLIPKLDNKWRSMFTAPPSGIYTMTCVHTIASDIHGQALLLMFVDSGSGIPIVQMNISVSNTFAPIDCYVYDSGYAPLFHDNSTLIYFASSSPQTATITVDATSVKFSINGTVLDSGVKPDIFPDCIDVEALINRSSEGSAWSIDDTIVTDSPIVAATRTARINHLRPRAFAPGKPR